MDAGVIDAYSSVCRSMKKLCPRIVPSPLWGINMAKLARVNPVVLSDVLEEVFLRLLGASINSGSVFHEMGYVVFAVERGMSWMKSGFTTLQEKGV